MDEIFGISMASIMVVLLGLLALCLSSVLWVAWRRRVLFNLGVRNLPRRKAQTVLIVAGLMLSTLIMSAALGTGDTIDHSLTNDVYTTYGHVDLRVIASRDVEASASAAPPAMDASALTTVEAALAGSALVDGVMPELRESVPAVNEAAQLAEPAINFVGLDPARVGDFGGIRAADGSAIDLAAMPAGSVVVSETAAERLALSAGDTVTVFVNNRPITLLVHAVGENSYLTGAGRDFNAGGELAGMVTTLDQAQQLLGRPGQISAVLISNDGGVRDSLAASDRVVDLVTPSLEGAGLGVAAIKQEWVELGETTGQIFTAIFLVLGLFSIAAGILLIVLIFTMLAAERRAEMGMARAVGTHRRQLIQQFVAEGSGYAIIAGMAGAALGVLATLAIGWGMGVLLGDVVNIVPHVTPRSLIVAYSLGVVITFLAVVLSSWKISRLNVVAAIRDIPDESSPRRRKRTLVWAGLLLLAGLGLTLQGADSGSAFPFYAGMSTLPFGIALILRFFGAPSRPIYSIIGLYLVVFWLLPEDQFTRIFGAYDGDIEMFFLSGIFMVIGATILIVQNTDLLLRGVTAIGGLFRGKLPAFKTAVAYPGAARGRTGLTIAMFSLIIFSLVMMATMNRNYVNLFLGDEANAGWQVAVTTSSSNPVDDLEASLVARGVDTGPITGIGALSVPQNGEQFARLPGTEDWKRIAVSGLDDGFLSTAELSFGQRAEGYESDEAILDALRTSPDLAIVDATVLAGADGFGGDPDAFRLTEITAADKSFAPVAVEIATANGPRAVTVIGVLDSRISIMWGLFTSKATIDELYPDTSHARTYFVRIAEAADATVMANRIESALLTSGVQAVSVQDQLEESQRQSTGFLYLIQGFMGLGLFVGVAAIGVIAFRSVVERRQQIGVLRAIGYQRNLVSLSFMIETAFIVGVGSLSGTILGLILARNLFTSDEAAADVAFTVPAGLISIILGATVAVALLMTWIPSRQAASISPAEALRYE